MKILLIRPDTPENSLDMTELILTEPLELEILYTHLKASHRVRIIDLQVQQRSFLYAAIREWQPDIACFTGYINQAGNVKDLCRIIKSRLPSCLCIAGGVHAAVCPEDFQCCHVDYILSRNPINAFHVLLEQYKSSLPRGRSTIMSSDDPDPVILSPERPVFEKFRDQFHYLHFKETAIVKTSYGCPYHCSFCFCTKITPFHAADIAEVVHEIKQLDAENIFIVDDTFLFNRSRLESFYELMKDVWPVKNFIVYGRSDFIAENGDLMEKLSSVGVKNVIVGLESLNDQELEGYNKRLSRDDNYRAVEILHRCGIEVYGLFIAHPDWTSSDFSKLHENIRRLRLKNITLSVFTPFPGTEEYDRSLGRLTIKRNEYHKWDFTYLPFKPAHMSAFSFYCRTARILSRTNLNVQNLINVLSHRPSLVFALFKTGLRMWKKILSESIFSFPVWDFWARHYDGLWAQKFSLGPTQKKVTRMIQDLAIQGRHLDIGCGTGKLIHELGCDRISSTGMDRSMEMLRNISGKYSTLCPVLQADGAELPFGDATFDCITVIHALPYIYPKEKAFQEFARVLKKDGVIIIANANAETLWDHFFILLIKATTFKGKYLSRKSLCGQARKAGLRLISKEQVTTFPMPSINMLVFKKGAE